MSLIVDTYNVLHTVGVLPPEIAGAEPADLAELIARSRYRHQRVTLVCDGVPREDAPRGRVGGVSFRYAGADRTADDLIAQMVRRSSSPRRMTVVSSDRAVLREARRRRCNTLRSDEFLEHLAHDHETPKAPTPDPGPARPQSGGDPGRFLPSELLREAETITEDDVAPASDAPPAAEPDRDRSPADESPPAPAQAPDPASRPSKPRRTFLPQDLIAEAESMLADDARERAEQDRQQAAAQQARRAAERSDADRDSPEAARRGTRPSDAYRAILPEDLIADAEQLTGIDPDRLDADLEEQFAGVDNDAESDQPPKIQAHMPDDVLAEAETLWQSGGDEEPLPVRLGPAAKPPAPPRPSGEAGPAGPGAGVPRPPESDPKDDEKKTDKRSRDASRRRGRKDSKSDNAASAGSRRQRRDTRTDEPRRDRRG